MNSAVSEFTAISGLLRRTDAEIAAEMAKVKDFRRLATHLSLYDDASISRIINGLPSENRNLVKRLTYELKTPYSKWSEQLQKDTSRFGRYTYHSSQINLHKLLPSLLLGIILLAISGYMV